MSKKHSVERAKAYKAQYKSEMREATRDQFHWTGFIISIIAILVSVGFLFAMGLTGLPFFGGSAILAFFIGYVIGVYGWSVRRGKERYDFASAFGIFLGFVFVILNLIQYTAFGAILLSLAGASGIYSSMIAMGTFAVLVLYWFFGFISTKETKV